MSEIPVLDPVEQRVLGCLIEKERTTPEYYPLTLNALRNACNQKSNRNPVMQLDDADVQRAIDELRIQGLVMRAADSARATKYRHTLAEKMDLLEDEIAVLCELLIRGPQTVGELRTHCARMEDFATTDDVQAVLHRLARRDPALVQELPRRPGQKEARWAPLLGGPIDVEAWEQAQADVAPTVISRDERIDALEAEVAALKARVDELDAAFAAFRQQFE
ncbi:MAG: DUF480 domain-containing protein [Candidatus Dadabacteria bacterium]|nr:MAG: DUF480 domain-containing protein [Candidatus Dadabacteria bacterium]